MKMKKMIFLMLTLLIWGAASMNAQVNIGSSADPTPGTVLDLSQTGSKNLGLRLPVVSLSGATPFQLTDGGDGSAAAGTIVYNDGLGALSEAGVYVWSGAAWTLASAPAVPPVVPHPVSGLTLDNEAAYTAPATGGSIQRTATIAPDNADEKGVNWTSNNPDVTITPSNPVASGTPVTITVASGSAAITGAIVTATAVGDGSKTKTITINRDAPSYPAGSVVINTDVRTGFMSGAYTSYVKFPKPQSGTLLVAAADGNSGSTKTWNSISGYNSTSYQNTDANKFVGANAGCDDGWRLPSIVELEAIADYFLLSYGSYQGPTSSQVPGFTQLQAVRYWSSTYSGPVISSYGNAWLMDLANNNFVGEYNTDRGYYVRCVLDLN
ncbi:hypothetical protein FACS189440_00880 [Bacteroidia bacterium]|nr:hypothetical protein FACS189440_00880 [Bacteroidia bacterium]